MRENDWAILAKLLEEPNITKAAEQLFMTQPSLSKRLQQIERDLDTAIAIRGAKGIVLTPQGEYLARAARDMMQEFRTIRRQVAAMNDGQTGTLKIGVTNSFGRFTLPSILNRYKSLYPGTDFKIDHGLSQDIVRMVDAKAVYVGFIRGDHAFDGHRHLLSVDCAYIVSKMPVSLQDLPALPRIHYALDPLTVKLIDRWWNAHFQVPPLIGMTVNHGDTCREMIANGLGYGIFLVPDFLTGADDLCKMPMCNAKNEPVKRNTWLICSNDAYKIPLVRRFVDFVRA